MDMNDGPPTAPVSPDDLAVYALDAHDADDAAAIVAHLDASPDTARWEQDLRSAAGEFAAGVVNDVMPLAELRCRVLAEARRRRQPAAVVAGASPIDVHRVEVARAILVLHDLTVDDWARPVDPSEFAGWTVHDVAVHLSANESLLASQLGVPVAGIPETATDNEDRTAQARARHSGRPPTRAVAELEAAAKASDTELAARGEARLDEPIDWWGRRAATRVAVLVRAFETWTHADDIRRAVGVPMVAPPLASMLTMTEIGCGLVPSMLATRGASSPRPARPLPLHRPRRRRLGRRPGSRRRGPSRRRRRGRHRDRHRGRRRVPSHQRPARPRELTYVVVGDEQLAHDVIDALPALAVL